MKLVKVNSVKARKYTNFTTSVSDKDYNSVSKYNWSLVGANHTKYCSCTIDGRRTSLHRFVLGINDPSVYIDHKDGNGLNNCRSNLRIATNAQNQQNKRPRGSSKYLGVSLRDNGMWRAGITVNKKQVYLGYFDTEEEAHNAYLEAKKIYHVIITE